MPTKTYKNDNRSATQYRKKRFHKAKGMPLSRRQLQQVKQAIVTDNNKQIETRYFDIENVLSTGTSSTPVIYHISSLVAGTDFEGDRIRPKYLTFRSKLTGASAGGGDNQAYRLMLVQWKDNATENTIQIGDVLESSSFVYSNYNHGEIASARVLFDEMGTVAKSNSNSDHTQFVKFQMDLSKVKPIEWDGSTITNNHLYLIFWSDEVANAPAFRWGTRLAYTDA